MKKLLASLVAGASLVLNSASWAQGFPARPVRILIPVPPGGTTDILVRIVASGMEKRLGQAVLIENRPGANGLVAAAAVKSSEADGYTLAFWTAPLLHPLFNKSGGLVLGKDLAPVSLLFRTVTVWYVRANLPVNSLQELVAYSKANPGKLNFGSPGALNDVVMQYLKNRVGLDYTSIPYKGQPQANTALLANEIEISSGGSIAILSLVQAGKLRPIFSTLASAVFPGVPTLTALGMPMEGAVTSFAMMAPMNTPRDVVAKLSSEASAVLKTPGTAEKIRKEYDVEALGTTPEEQMRIYTTEIQFWTEAARIANFIPE